MLEKDQAQFLSSLVYRRTARVGTLQQAVTSLRQLDKHYEVVERRWLWGAVLSTVGAIGLVFAGVANDGHGPWFTLAGVFGAAMVVTFFMKWRFGKLNTEDRRYELLGRVLRLLEPDLSAEQQLRLHLDLAAPDLRRKFVRKGKAGAWKAKFYEDPWLQLEGRLLDGTAFLLVVTEKFQHRTRWKTSRSGKLKRKTKTKTATEFRLRLKPKAKRYAHLSELSGQAMGAVQLPSQCVPKGITVEDGGLVLKVGLKVGWTEPAGKNVKGSGSSVVAMMFLSLYQILNLSRRLTKNAA